MSGAVRARLGGFAGLLTRPLAPVAAALWLLGALAAGAAYCMGYAILSGGSNAWARAFGWSAGAVLPWAIVFEAVKRWEARRAPLRWEVVAPILAGTGLVSLAFEAGIDRWIWNSPAAPLGLQLLRRLPAIGIVLLLLIARRSAVGPAGAVQDEAPPPALAELRYVRAADNYVELHYARGMRMERETLNRMEQRLRPRGFVRVHRSILVHPRHVTGVEPGRSPALVLDDGTRLPTGRRYQQAVRHFVP